MKVLWLLCLLPCLSCSAHRIVLVNFTIPKDCIANAELLGCDARYSPPLCKYERVNYTKGCEQLAVKH